MVINLQIKGFKNKGKGRVDKWSYVLGGFFLILFVLFSMLLYTHYIDASENNLYLKPEKELSKAGLSEAAEIIEERLDLLGYNLTLKVVDDRILLKAEEKIKEGNIPSQRKPFRAVIDNKTIFTGEDIKNVCESAGCSYAENPQNPCTEMQDGTWRCEFIFEVTINNEAAKRQAEITKDLKVVSEDGMQYLNKTLQLYLGDDVLDELRISAELQGRSATSFSVSGQGEGESYEQARQNSFENMKKLQSYLSTKPLPCDFQVNAG